ncbi:hypothetical protein GCM10009554_42220 [Kribbella koreensis]|uniref:Uncharacterized protein n=1 Tax=Kribbella koreensis TaxID=57909 RepID=A0ABP4BA32_9ACTN
MTDLLKDTLVERADATEPSTLDLDTIMTTGERRMRRRRAVGVLGVGAIAAVVVASGLGVLNETSHPSGTADPAGQTAKPFAQRRATYAVRDQLHYGQEVFSIGKGELFNNYVQTDAGFVYVTMPHGDGGLDGKPAPDGSDAGRGYVTLLDRTGSHRIGGKYARSNLVADDHGSLAGWAEFATKQTGPPTAIVVYDVAARRQLLRIPTGQPVPGVAGSPNVSRLLAIDEGMAYFAADKRVFRVDLRTKQGKVFSWPATPILILDTQAISDGKFLYQTLDAKAPNGRLVVGPTLDPADGHPLQLTFPQPTQSLTGAFSPDAEHVVVTRPEPGDPSETGIQLFATDTGREIPLLATGYQHQRFGQWLDNETFTTAGTRANHRTDLLRCSTQTLRCDVIGRGVAENFSTDRANLNGEHFAFPVGYRVD